MSEFHQTLFIPPPEFDPMDIDMDNIYNFDAPLAFQDASAHDWEIPQSGFGENAPQPGEAMFDPSTGGTWQPMEIPESSIDPALLTLSNPSLELSTNIMPAAFAFSGKDVVFPSQSLDYFDPTLYAPFSPEIPATAPTYPISPLEKAEPYFHTTEPKAKPTKMSKNPRPHREPTQKGPAPPAAKRAKQTPLRDVDCWCSLCTNPTPIINSFDIALLGNKTKLAQRNALRKQQGLPTGNQARAGKKAMRTREAAVTRKLGRAEERAIRKQDAAGQNTQLWDTPAMKALGALPKTGGRGLKRKVRDDEESEDSELSEVPGLDDVEDEVSEDEEYRPTSKKAKGLPAKRRRSTRGKGVGRGKKVPKGLNIAMKGW